MSDLGIRSVQLAPDGSTVTWLAAGDDGARNLDLWELNVASGRSRILVRAADLVKAGEEALTDEEKARRERKRLGDVGGITEYSWAPQGDQLLFPLGGHLYLVRLTAPTDGERRWTQQRLTTTSGEVTEAQVSPLGGYASYVRSGHLWAVDLASGQTLRLSGELGPSETAGAAEFIAQEEMHRFSGYWWSSDDRFVAYTVVDEAPVAVVTRMEVYADRFATIDQRYPYAGAGNAKVRLMLCSPSEAGRSWPVPLPPYEYLCRVQWHKTGSQLLVQVEPREQMSLDLYSVDAQTAKATLLLTEHDQAWINLHDDLTALSDGRFIWASERSGFKHLELRRGDGQLERTLTHGEWAVGSVRGVDEASGTVYFDGFKDSPLELHLYAIPLNAGVDEAPRRLTLDEGWHETTLSRRGELWVDVHSNPQTPPSIRLYGKDSKMLAELSAQSETVLPAADLAETIYGNFPGPDGTLLFYRLRRPRLGATKRLPAVIHVYGGPGAQMVQKRWMPRQDSLESSLLAAGFVVLAVDNRGSLHRGKRFESVLKGRFGGAELDDQAAAAQWLARRDFVDPERIGICGASYGGFMTLMALLRRPELFKVGVAIAPVTDWRLYDTHYTERYLGTPQDQPEAYAASAVLPYAANLAGKLLMVHGMADDNVLYTHSTKLYQALQAAGKMFDIMVYPGEKHGITGAASRRHLEAALVDYFVTHLGSLKERR